MSDGTPESKPSGPMSLASLLDVESIDANLFRFTDSRLRKTKGVQHVYGLCAPYGSVTTQSDRYLWRPSYLPGHPGSHQYRRPNVPPSCKLQSLYLQACSLNANLLQKSLHVRSFHFFSRTVLMDVPMTVLFLAECTLDHDLLHY